jgi:acyl carrier protein
MSDIVDAGTRHIEATLRGDRLINDAEVLPGPDASAVTVLVVPQGYRPGHVLRERVMRLLPEIGDRVQVALVRAIPRDPGGRLRRAEAVAMTERPGVLHRYEAPASGPEQALAALVGEVLPGVQVSMSDAFAALGGDSVATMELTALIHERLGIDVDPQLVFTAESLRELASTLAIEAGTDQT